MYITQGNFGSDTNNLLIPVKFHHVALVIQKFEFCQKMLRTVNSTLST